MKFTNATADELLIPSLGLSVPAGGEFVATADEAAGLVGQCGEGGPFRPADDAARAAVKAATDPPVKKAAAKKAPRKAAAKKAAPPVPAVDAGSDKENV